MGSPNFVVTLVHGTFARKAVWPHAGSRLRQVLEDGLGSVLFQPITWSGGNTVAARSAAARQLSEQLRVGLSTFPDARHIVIGHSHGGNIALYALRDPFVRERISAVVCLSTPFLNARRREASPHEALVFAYVLWLFLVAGVPWVVSGHLVLGLAAGVGILAAGNLMLRFALRQSRNVYRSLLLPRLSAVPVLIVLTNNFLPCTMYRYPCRINLLFRLLFEFEMVEYIAPNNTLIADYSLFAERVQISISVYTSS